MINLVKQVVYNLLTTKITNNQWLHYEKVMAKRLSDTFQSTSTLLAAHELALSQGDDVVQFGCSNYTEGAAIGKVFNLFLFLFP